MLTENKINQLLNKGILSNRHKYPMRASVVNGYKSFWYDILTTKVITKVNQPDTPGIIYEGEEPPMPLNVNCDKLGSIPMPSLEYCARAMSNDATCYKMNGIYIHLARQEIVATDGHRLHLVKNTSLVKPELPTRGVQGVIVPKSAIDAALKVFGKSESLELRKHSSRIYELHTEDSSVLFYCVDGEYPDYVQVIPALNDYNGYTHAFDFKALNKFKVFSKHSIMTNVRITNERYEVRETIREKDHALAKAQGFNVIEAFQGKNKDKSVWQIVHPEVLRSVDIEHNAKAFNLGINLRYLQDADLGETYTYIKDAVSPIQIFSKDRNTMALIMPVRL